jgi:hypothetical protein
MQDVFPGPRSTYYIITTVALSVGTVLVLINTPHIDRGLPTVRGWYDGLLARLKVLWRGGSDQVEIGEEPELEENHENGDDDDDGIELDEQDHGVHHISSELSLV